MEQGVPAHSGVAASTDGGTGAALRDSEARFRQIAEEIDLVFWVCELEPQLHVSYVNPAFERIWGRPARSLYADPRLWLHSVIPAHRDRVEAAFRRWREDPSSAGYAVEYIVERPGGEQRWIRDRGRAMLSPVTGRPRRLTGVAEDITSRKRAKAAAAQVQQELRELAEGLPQLVWTCRPDGECDYLSPQWVAYTGEPAAQQLGRGWLCHVHPDDRAALEASIDTALRRQSPCESEHRLRRHDGTYRWFQSRAWPVRDASGAIKRWFGTASDVHDLKSTLAALGTSRACLAAVLDNLTEGLLISPLEGGTVALNPAARALFGVTGEADVARDRLFDGFRLFGLDGTELPAGRQPLSRIERGESIERLVLRLVHVAAGWEKVMDCRGARVSDPQGRPIAAVLRVTDVTERHRHAAEIARMNTEMEQRVRERTAELEAALKQLEAFSYTVSHDLRAPLRALDGFSKIVLDEYGPQLPESGRRYLGIIRDSAQKMGRLITDLLAFSRTGRVRLSRRAVNTQALVTEAVATLAPLREGRRIDLRIGSLPPCHGDVSLLRQVWVNLLSNAFKYSRQRDPAVIEVSGEAAADGSVRYRVRDNGVGFDMRHADKLFGVFERLHRTAEFEGNGVGLAIVQQILERHGGSIRAESAPGDGATFQFHLPAA
ncbi:PAS domain-containing protein [Aquincola sp. MAHUQ-54]|uniref:histidine kinase n=1 Tax=Aquincola agrisoli TaxID=3119538 RepID=A0AAW9QAH5_9BURK